MLALIHVPQVRTRGHTMGAKTLPTRFFPNLTNSSNFSGFLFPKNSDNFRRSMKDSDASTVISFSLFFQRQTRPCLQRCRLCVASCLNKVLSAGGRRAWLSLGHCLAPDPFFFVYDVPLRVIDGAQRIGEFCCILFTPRTVEFVRLFFGDFLLCVWLVERFIWTTV